MKNFFKLMKERQRKIFLTERKKWNKYRREKNRKGARKKKERNKESEEIIKFFKLKEGRKKKEERTQNK